MEPSNGKFTEFERADLDWLMSQPLEVRIDVMKHRLPVCQIIANQIMEGEMISYAGQRYSRAKTHEAQYGRGSSNPMSIRIGDQ